MFWRLFNRPAVIALLRQLVDLAAPAADESDLVPHWIGPGEHRVERHVWPRPYTTEIDAFDRLKHTVATPSSRATPTVVPLMRDANRFGRLRA